MISFLYSTDRVLFWWHLAAAFLHLACAVAVGVIWGVEGSWSVPVTYEWVEWVDEADGTSIEPRVEPLFQFPLLSLSVLFAAITALSHIAQAVWVQPSTPNQIRWWEYSLSATVMIWLIATLSGLSSVFSLIWLAGLTWVTMFLGWISEVMQIEYANAVKEMMKVAKEGNGSTSTAESLMRWLGRKRVSVIVMAWIVQVLAWIPLMWTFFVSVNRSDAPEVIKAINPTLFVFFCVGFGLLHVLPNLEWRSREMGYIILSFVSKFTLNAFIVAGLYMRTRENVSVTS